MTPLLLQKALIKEIKLVTKDIELLTIKGKKSCLNVFPQRVPVKSRNEEFDFFPYCVVQVLVGEIKDTQVITAIFKIGIYHKDNDVKGHEELLNIIQKILERFGKNPVLDNKYVCLKEKKWEITDEDSHPYYFGGLLLQFETHFFNLEGGI